MTSVQETDNIKKELSTLSCPFTWQLKNAANYYVKVQRLNRDELDDTIHEEYYSSLEKIIAYLVFLYGEVLFAEMDAALKRLEKSEDILMEMKNKQEDEDIMTVVEHIFNSTKCHFFFERNDIERVKMILPTIIKISNFSDIEKAALAGCQSIAWSIYTDFSRKEAIDLAKQAIEQNSDRGLWHFILAKSMRRERRLVTFFSPPCEIELKHFTAAYEKSPNVVFGMYLAQVLRDLIALKPFSEKAIHENKLIELYKDILKKSENNYKILLKLALGFTRIKSNRQFELAKYCLDAAEKIEPNNSTYFHYKGIYLETIGNKKEALEFYKKGGELNNFLADMAYAKACYYICLDPLIHLQSMLVKYANTNKERNQEMHLCIAICYFLQNDLKYALEYFLKAIEIDPKSEKLKAKYEFQGFSTKNYNGGIYTFLKKKFLIDATSCREYRWKDKTFTTHYNKLQQLCYSYNE